MPHRKADLVRVDPMDGLKTRGGYTDFGRPRLSLPSYTVLTDRVTGNLFALSHDVNVTTVEMETFSATKHTDRVEYGPNSGPRAESNPQYKLVLDNGVLSFELSPLPEKKRQPPILTRKDFQRSSLQIDVDSSGAITTTQITF